MIGLNGGLLGAQRTTNTTTGSGLWTANEQALLKRASTWPLSGDLYFGYNSLLLHMDGSNGSTTFSDNSSNALTVAAKGNAQISTAQSKFGGASGYFDGTGDALAISSSSLLQFGTGEFTVEAWVYVTNTPSATGAQIVGRGEYGTNSDWLFCLDSAQRVFFYFQSSLTQVLTAATVPLNTWKHIAAARSGTTVRIFIDGTAEATAIVSSTTEATASGEYTIGADQAYDESNFTGYIDDLRITKGIARYTANFTVPTAAFPNA